MVVLQGGRMNSGKCLVCSVLFVLLSACSSDSKWHAEQIPYPRSTPFDRNQFARQAFLDGFRVGYRAEMHQGPQAVDVLSPPYLQARQLGYRAGAAQARQEREGANGMTNAPAQ
jgi:hypothetical protein